MSDNNYEPQLFQPLLSPLPHPSPPLPTTLSSSVNPFSPPSPYSPSPSLDTPILSWTRGSVSAKACVSVCEGGEEDKGRGQGLRGRRCGRGDGGLRGMRSFGDKPAIVTVEKK